MEIVGLIVAAGIGIASIILMRRQLKVMDRQLEIMARQDDLLLRRAELRLVAYITEPTEGDTNTYLSLHALNSGNRSAAHFYWHVFVPVGFSQHQRVTTYKGETSADHTGEVAGIQCRRFRDSSAQPIYPSRSVKIGQIACDNAAWAGPVTVHWKLVCEDGAYPPVAQEVGDLIVKPGGPLPSEIETVA